jgi:hypothetical protein
LNFEAINETEINWMQTGKLESHLTTKEGKILATLVWKNSFGTLATGESRDGKWTMKRAGFLHPKIIVRNANSDEELGVLKMDSRGSGTLELTEKSAFYFEKGKQGISVIDVERNNILALKPAFTGKWIGASVRIDKIEDPRKELSLLNILAWYIVLLISNYDNDASFIAMMVAIW